MAMYDRGMQDPSEIDALYDEAVGIAIQVGEVSPSLLQRRLRIGFARARHLIDLLEDHHLISPYRHADQRATTLPSHQHTKVPSHVAREKPPIYAQV